MLRIIALVMGFSLVFAVPASAGFVENRAAWLRMNETQQLGYVSGIVDGLMIETIGDQWSAVRAQGWRDCLRDNEFNNGDILEMVQLSYQDVANWSKPPVSILINQINRVCAPYENVYRRDRGLPEILASNP